MQHVRWLHEPKPETDTVVVVAFTGWNDAGEAASTALQVLVGACSPEIVAEIEPEEFTNFTEVRPIVSLDADGRRDITWPMTRIAVARIDDRQLVFVLGQEPSMRWRTFAEELVDVFDELGATRVVTFGALLADVPHTRPVRMMGFGTAAVLRDLDVERSHYEGPTGMLTVLLVACADRSIETAALWACVPAYAADTASPKATVALIEQSRALLGVNLRPPDLAEEITAYEASITRAVEQDDALGRYVEQLETAFDAQVDDQPSTGLADDVERFLRDQLE